MRLYSLSIRGTLVHRGLNLENITNDNATNVDRYTNIHEKTKEEERPHKLITYTLSCPD
jgi:hypothetical protein